MSDRERPQDPPSESEMGRLRRAKDEALDRLLRIPGVHTVGVGYKRRGGEVTDELSVVVYVDRKQPPDEIRAEWLIPREIRFFLESAGEETVVSTDVVERPRAVEYPHLANGALETRVRPVPGGRSIQGGSGGGTLGGWMWDDLNDAPVLLSNNHVLGSTVGANVYQPWGSFAAADQIADNVRTGSMDATIAAPTDSSHVVYEIEGVGPAVYETATAVLNMQVEKSGATTEHTTGYVVAVNLTKNHLGSTNDFEVMPDTGQSKFAYFGDSGSLIVERTHPTGASWKRVVGLLWGGDPPVGNAYGHQIVDVFADLDLTTICAGAVAEIFDSLFAASFALEPALRVPPVDLVRDRPRPWPPRIPRHRGFARELEARIKRSDRGSRIAKLVQRDRVAVAQLVVARDSRRVLEAGIGPFLDGLWSASEVMDKQVTDEDVARFSRALTTATRGRRDLEELAEEAKSLLDELPGRTLGEVLR